MSLAHQIVQPSKPSAQMQFHPLADLFPLMTEEELEGLTADIKEHGQREPIVIFEGKILDGRNRYRACETLGFQVKSKDWDGQGSAQAFVVSHNLHRRHLNASQRALIAARLSSGFRGGDRRSEEFKTGIPVLKVEAAAKLLNVNKDTVSDAHKVLAKATPEEIATIDRGEAAVSSLAKQIRLKVPTEQRKVKAADPHRDRADTYRANSQLWNILKDALDNLTNLPRPIDVVAVARAHDRGKFTDTKLLPALQWLTEFSDAWTNPDTEANSGRKDRPSRKAKEAASPEGTEGSAPETGGALREAGPDRGTGNGGWREDHADPGHGG